MPVQLEMWEDSIAEETGGSGAYDAEIVKRISISESLTSDTPGSLMQSCFRITR
jgi:hypothetical protein